MSDFMYGIPGHANCIRCNEEGHCDEMCPMPSRMLPFKCPVDGGPFVILRAGGLKVRKCLTCKRVLDIWVTPFHHLPDCEAKEDQPEDFE